MSERAASAKRPPARWRGRLALGALSLAVHAALLGALLRNDGPRRGDARAVPGQVALRPLQLTWVRPLRRSTPEADTAGTVREPSRAAAKPPTPRVARVARARAAPVVAAAIVVPAAAPAPRGSAPDGSVFGLPQIAFAATRAPAVRAEGVAAPTAMQAALFTQQRMQAAAARDAARAQLHAALQRELAAWPQLDHAAICRVHATGTDCDDDALRPQLLTRVDALQALLAAMRQFEPNADALTIEFRDGRYRGAAQRTAL